MAGKAKRKFTRPKPQEANNALVSLAPAWEKIVEE
jgi:hypothetical protein